MGADAPPSRRRARAWPAAAVAVAVLAAGGGWAAGHGGVLGRPAPVQAAPEVPTGTAAVTRTDVVRRQQVAGTLGYEGGATVVARSPGGAGGPSGGGGTFTRLPAPGAVLRRGQAAYEVDGRPVPLWYGDRPAWRDFRLGMADGPDVRALEANLVALGFDPGHAVTVDSRFTWATRAAVRRWQAAALGLPPALRGGAVPLGGVVFLPGAVRVAAVDAKVGAPVQPGAPVLLATSTRPAVMVALDPGMRHLVRRGNRVLVTLPGGKATPGRVATVGRAAVLPGPAAGQDSAQGQDGAAGQDGGQRPTVPVTIRLADPRAASGLDQAPVQVAITTEARRGVLAVPIAALLATPGGGYAVEVVAGGARRRVPVRPGLFDETAGVVEVAGGGLEEGATVEVPAP
jgi:multidrug efflux system membrane fusion protein